MSPWHKHDPPLLNLDAPPRKACSSQETPRFRLFRQIARCPRAVRFRYHRYTLGERILWSRLPCRVRDQGRGRGGRLLLGWFVHTRPIKSPLISQTRKYSHSSSLPHPPLDNTPLLLYKPTLHPEKILENFMAEIPPQDDTIQAVANLIEDTVFHAEGKSTWEDRHELCHRAAIAVINHLAGVYDEMMKNEPAEE